MPRPNTPTRWDAIPTLTDDERVASALNVSPATATDEESRAAAQTLSRQVLIAHQIAQMPDESFKTEAEKYAAASKIVETMTGAKDLDGRLWNGGKPFKTGKEYLMSVRDVLTRGMTAAADPDLQAWLAMSDEEKDAKLEREQGVLSSFAEGVGDATSQVAAHYGINTELSETEYEAAPEDVRNASFMLSRDDTPQAERDKYGATIREWRTGEWRKLQRRSEYEAKLRRKNALLYLPDMIKSLKTDEAKTLAGELAQDPSTIPDNWEARLTRLPTHDIETLAQIRGMTREQTEGGFFNWLGDMGIAAYNGALGKSYKPYLKACLAGCEMDRNRMGAAAAYLEDALAKDPEEPVALFNDAVLHAREPVPNPMKAHTRAANEFMRFLLSPRSEAYPDQRADAVRRLAALSRAHPPELQRQIDDLLEESHAAQTPRYAADCASKAFLLDPSFSDSLAWYATCVARLGAARTDDAAKLRQIGHRLFPADGRFAEAR